MLSPSQDTRITLAEQAAMLPTCQSCGTPGAFLYHPVTRAPLCPGCYTVSAPVSTPSAPARPTVRTGMRAGLIPLIVTFALVALLFATVVLASG